VLRGAPLPFAPSVLLAVRPRTPGDADVRLPSPALIDGCSDGIDSEAFIFDLPNARPRYRDLPPSVRGLFLRESQAAIKALEGEPEQAKP
jgi:hypothetical protein